MTTRTKIITAVVAGALVLAAGFFAFQQVFGLGPTYTVTAHFKRIPGLYEGNAVAVLGVRLGEITSITPRDGYVEVKMAVPKDTLVPRDAKAALVAPNPVSDRVIELFPAYREGDSLPDGAVIPLERTMVPLELDEIFANVSAIANTLGPAGANKEGSLNDALAAVARLVDGKGVTFKQTLDAIAQALPALTSDPEGLKRLLTSLDQITGTLASHRTTINSLYDNLAAVTHQLAGEKDVLAGAIRNLDTALGQVTTFVQQNKDAIGASVQNLESVTKAVLTQRQGLIDTFDVLPLAFQNINGIIDLDGPCEDGRTSGCPGIGLRLNLTANVRSVIDLYCGDAATATIPVIAESIPGAGAIAGGPSTVGVLCAATYGVIQGHPGPPGAPQTPDLGLAQFLGR